MLKKSHSLPLFKIPVLKITSIKLRSAFLMMLMLGLMSFHSYSLESGSTSDADASKPNSVSEEQIEVAKAFAAALNSQQVDPIANFFDFVDFGELVISKLDTERNIRRALASEYKKTAFARSFTQSSFILPKETPGRFSYTKVVTTEEFGARPMIRLDHVTGGHEFMLVFFNDANKIIDLFYASKGSLITSYVAGTTQLILPAQNRFVARLLGKEGNAEETLSIFTKMIALRNEGKFIEMLREMQTLPERVQAYRPIIDMEILIAQNVSEDTYMDALAKLYRYHGDDPTTAFMLIDYHATDGELIKAAEATNKAIAFWGEDAALLNLKANMLFLQNDIPGAIEVAKDAIEAEPTFEDSYWTLIALQDLSDNYSDLTKTLAEIKKYFNEELTPQDVKDAGVAMGYLASDEFKKVLERGDF
jgi:tetratricopeptide (TPR) repeat protein